MPDDSERDAERGGLWTVGHSTRTAEELIERTGVRRLQGWLFEARGQKQEAIRLYEEIGATGFADRIRNA